MQSPFKIEKSQLPKLPAWLRNPTPKYHFDNLIKKMPLQGMTTVCEEAKCPNRGECIKRGVVTVMILGSECTRGCTFCNVGRGTPSPVDPEEPQKMLDMAEHMGVKYLVITSPTRDDLFDGGASQFRKVIEHVKDKRPELGIEVLIPDFQNQESSFDEILESYPDTICFDIQTVKDKYRFVRPGFSYQKALELFAYFNKKIQAAKDFIEKNTKDHSLYNHNLNISKIKLKSGIMVGHGESQEEMLELFADLYNVGVRYITVGQYIQPPDMDLPVVEYVKPEIYDFYTVEAQKLGLWIQASPFTRSSYLADKLAEEK